VNEGIPRAVVNYETKLRLGACGPLDEWQIRQHVANYGAVYSLMKQAVEQGREVLCTAGVSTVWFAYYHSYTRELFKLTRQELSSRACAATYAQIAEKWRLRGLDEAVLKEIGTTVFNLPWPDKAGEGP
jgi:hypothetical protein